MAASAGAANRSDQALMGAMAHGSDGANVVATGAFCTVYQLRHFSAHEERFYRLVFCAMSGKLSGVKVGKQYSVCQGCTGEVGRRRRKRTMLEWGECDATVSASESEESLWRIRLAVRQGSWCFSSFYLDSSLYVEKEPRKALA
jgi:hypothetical protein